MADMRACIISGLPITDGKPAAAVPLLYNRDYKYDPLYHDRGVDCIPRGARHFMVPAFLPLIGIFREFEGLEPVPSAGSRVIEELCGISAEEFCRSLSNGQDKLPDTRRLHSCWIHGEFWAYLKDRAARRIVRGKIPDTSTLALDMTREGADWERFLLKATLFYSDQHYIRERFEALCPLLPFTREQPFEKYRDLMRAGNEEILTDAVALHLGEMLLLDAGRFWLPGGLAGTDREAETLAAHRAICGIIRRS